MLPKGIKKQVLGGVLFCLGIITALLARAIGFELDIFYVVMSMIGAGLFLYGAIQKHQHKLTRGFQHVDEFCTESDVSIDPQLQGAGSQHVPIWQATSLDEAKSFDTRQLAISNLRESR